MQQKLITCTGPASRHSAVASVSHEVQGDSSVEVNVHSGAEGSAVAMVSHDQGILQSEMPMCNWRNLALHQQSQNVTQTQAVPMCHFFMEQTSLVELLM